MQERFPKSDWKLFRTKLPDWQEAYMDKLNQEYIQLLSGGDSPSEKFWQLDKRIKADKRSPGVLLHLSRTDLFYSLLSLLLPFTGTQVEPTPVIEERAAEAVRSPSFLCLYASSLAHSSMEGNATICGWRSPGSIGLSIHPISR